MYMRSAASPLPVLAGIGNGILSMVNFVLDSNNGESNRRSYLEAECSDNTAMYIRNGARGSDP
eukprot:SAG31_NODE_25418_length_461_cov_3.287293_1_plen_63_part_00